MSVSPCETCAEECLNPERGCPAWKKWFIQYWNENICVRPEPVSREVLRYEHPDRVREMAPKKPEEMTAAEWMAAQMEGANGK